MADNTLVSWAVCERPWELEDDLIARLDLPLNLDGNSRNQFHQELTKARARCVSRANALPVVANPGVGGRLAQGFGTAALYIKFAATFAKFTLATNPSGESAWGAWQLSGLFYVFKEPLGADC